MSLDVIVVTFPAVPIGAKNACCLDLDKDTVERGNRRNGHTLDLNKTMKRMVKSSVHRRGTSGARSHYCSLY